MKNLNIPIYRAKKIDSDEYVEGLLGEKRQSDGTFKYYSMVGNGYEIDPSTLAIHFPDMLDNEGNKIFASLSEDGKGGDKIEFYRNGKYINGIAYYENKFINYDGYGISPHIEETLKVIGIQEWY